MRPDIHLLAEKLIDICSEEYYSSELFEMDPEMDIRDL